MGEKNEQVPLEPDKWSLSELSLLEISAEDLVEKERRIQRDEEASRRQRKIKEAEEWANSRRKEEKRRDEEKRRKREIKAREMRRIENMRYM